jgi:predicted nucleic acid-binding protein
MVVWRLHTFAFWDALILKAASVSGCSRIWSEDLHHDRKIDGLTIENPFLEAEK